MLHHAVFRHQVRSFTVTANVNDGVVPPIVHDHLSLLPRPPNTSPSVVTPVFWVNALTVDHVVPPSIDVWRTRSSVGVVPDAAVIASDTSNAYARAALNVAPVPVVV